MQTSLAFEDFERLQNFQTFFLKIFHFFFTKLYPIFANAWWHSTTLLVPSGFSDFCIETETCKKLQICMIINFLIA